LIAPTFTVFTPTYNRAHLLPRAYESLKSQTFRNFEWLIVDDGSTDDTQAVVESFRQGGCFPIRYIVQEHGGKHRAFNNAVCHARGELLMPLDSDDAFLPHTLERFHEHWQAIPTEKRRGFSAVTCLCQDQHGNLVGTKFPQDATDSDSMEIRYKYKVQGQKKGFHRTEVLKKHPFPELDGASFVPEGVVWNALAQRYKTRYVNDVLYIYWEDEVDNAEQLTQSASPAKHAASHALWHRSVLNHELRWFRFAPLNFLKSALHYSRFSFHAGAGLGEQISQLKPIGAKLLWLLMLPAGWLKFVLERS